MHTYVQRVICLSKIACTLKLGVFNRALCAQLDKGATSLTGLHQAADGRNFQCVTPFPRGKNAV